MARKLEIILNVTVEGPSPVYLDGYLAGLQSAGLIKSTRKHIPRDAFHKWNVEIKQPSCPYATMSEEKIEYALVDVLNQASYSLGRWMISVKAHQ